MSDKNQQLIDLLQEKESLQLKNKAIQDELSLLAHQRSVIHITYAHLENERTKTCARLRDIDSLLSGGKRDAV